MKKKFGIRTRVFLGFGFFTIIIINVFLFSFQYVLEKSFISNLNSDIEDIYEDIIELIDENKGPFLQIPSENLEEMRESGFFIHIGKNDEDLQKNYKLGYAFYGPDYIFRGDYKGNNILIGKKVGDFLNLKRKLIEILVFADLIGIFILIILIYLITNKILNPLLQLSKNISNYDIEKDKELIENTYGDSEIGIMTDSINKLIKKSKHILQSQKRFIQDSNHELKTPLMQIDTNIEILEEKDLDKNVLKRLQNIKKSSENINKIVSNLGFILRENNSNFNPKKIEIGKYLSDFKKSFENENTKIKIVEFDKLEIENDTYFLDRLFGNLIQNSIFYNDKKPEIIIEIYDKKVILKDNGIGISEDELEKIFDRFYRNYDSNIYNQNGNGLGLPIVKKICDDFGWKINITSEIGKGTNFEIVFK